MEDGLLLCCLCFSSLPIRRISIAHSQFHPPIHKPDGAPTRRAPHDREWSVSHAQGSRWGAGLSPCYFTQHSSFFYDKSAAEAALTGF